MRGGKRPNAGRKKGVSRWGDAETFNMRLPVSVKTWWLEFLQLVMERHLKAKSALHIHVATKDKHSKKERK